jgi:hypothetical protein
MSYYVLKIAITVVLIVLVSEIGKRNSFAAAVLASIPLISVLAMVWLYVETRDAGQVAGLARSIGWLVLPSLALFVALPVLLERGYGFYPSLGVSIGLTVACYYSTVVLVRYFGWQI